MKKLRILREERNLSQQKLAENFNLSQQAICKYEKGQAEPDIKTLILLADYFHVSVDYLIREDDDVSKDTGKPFLNAEPLSSRELHHLYLYRKLFPDAQNHLDLLLDTLSAGGGKNEE